MILFDALVSDEVLELAKTKAKKMLVGKRGHRASCKQDDINAMMLKLARQGKHVVRLKSGDPMIFGRAGEEIDVLTARGIRVDIVPSITSASAMAASLGISLTHRGSAHSLRFVTGHSRDGSLPETLDWRGLADPETTLVVYMGGRTCRDLAHRLIGEGLASSTPVVAVTSVSRKNETKWIGCLSYLAAGLLAIEPGEPVLIGIGRVLAACREQSTKLGLQAAKPHVREMRNDAA